VISNFQHIRRDGKVIPEGMTGVEMIAAGWVPRSPLPTAFAVVFRVYRNGAAYRVEIDATTGEVLGAEEVRA
jgi:hypothetical protein